MNINMVVYFSILFFVSELVLMITRRSKKSETKSSNDRMSLILFWIAIPVGLFLGFRNANYQEWSPVNYSIAWLGISVFFAGIMIRWFSIIQLSKEFTVDVAISETHKLRTDGIYKKVRHPSYSGLLLICFGLAVAMNSVVSLLVITLPILAAILYRIKIEENILAKEFGEQYKTYIKNTYRLIPKVF